MHGEPEVASSATVYAGEREVRVPGDPEFVVRADDVRVLPVRQPKTAGMDADAEIVRIEFPRWHPWPLR